ncbi:uncharacterized protein LOC133191428 [Saccostrea echinata]|uniref:uncharacterized protein LOC133191428 n=1 Tax=Saccostrea echinata TaxID=191078 RepID=UPI002A7FE9DE|nr:uncharacterized protein LOC133191428 [Saccostrea echinata]
MVRKPDVVLELVSVLLLYQVAEVKCYQFFSPVQSRSDWQSAHARCQYNFNGSLISGEAPALILNHAFASALGEDIWTNSYLALSPWIIYKGCFDITHIGAPQFYKITTNESAKETVGSCFKTCSDLKTPYFGLQGKSCFCLPALLLLKKDDEQCKSSCEGKFEKCGGPDAISVYEKFLPADKDFYESRQCATVTCKKNRKHVYRAHRCSGHFKTLCSNGDISSEKQSLKNSEQFCSQKKSNVIRDDVDDVCQTVGVENYTQYWINLHRYPTGPFQADYNESDVYPFSCFVYNNETQLRASSCDQEQHPYMCVVELTDENADSLCSSKLREENGFLIEDADVVPVTMENLCNRIQPPPVYMAYLTYSGVIGLAVSGGLVLLGCCIISLICCSKRTKKPKKAAHTEMTKVHYSPVKKNENV